MPCLLVLGIRLPRGRAGPGIGANQGGAEIFSHTRSMGSSAASVSKPRILRVPLASELAGVSCLLGTSSSLGELVRSLRHVDEATLAGGASTYVEATNTPMRHVSLLAPGNATELRKTQTFSGSSSPSRRRRPGEVDGDMPWDRLALAPRARALLPPGCKTSEDYGVDVAGDDFGPPPLCNYPPAAGGVSPPHWRRYMLRPDALSTTYNCRIRANRQPEH